jgi:hypothetical protein
MTVKRGSFNPFRISRVSSDDPSSTIKYSKSRKLWFNTDRTAFSKSEPSLYVAVIQVIFGIKGFQNRAGKPKTAVK